MQNQRYPLVVFENVPAASTVRKDFPIQFYASVEQLRVHFNPGPQGTLHVSPKVIKRDGTPILLFRVPTGGNEYMAGDDTVIQSPASQELIPGDIVRIDAENTDAVNAHIVDVTIEIDVLGGTARVV